jgi:hypothetical protein
MKIVDLFNRGICGLVCKKSQKKTHKSANILHCSKPNIKGEDMAEIKIQPKG